jgi:hypothetical protein
MLPQRHRKTIFDYCTMLTLCSKGVFDVHSLTQLFFLIFYIVERQKYPKRTQNNKKNLDTNTKMILNESFNVILSREY